VELRLIGNGDVGLAGGDQLGRIVGVGRGDQLDIEAGIGEIAKTLRHIERRVIGIGEPVEQHHELLAGDGGGQGPQGEQESGEEQSDHGWFPWV